MEAIVLAGGFGTRLREVVPDLPKPMAPVAGRPFLEIVLRSLATRGFTRVVLALGYKADVIATHFGDTFEGMAIVHVVESEPLGTGGAIRQALARCEADHVFIFNGDTYLALEAAEIEACWQTWHEPIVVARAVPDTARYGRVEMEAGRFTQFSEKGTAGPGLINAGCYVFPRDLLDAFSVGVPFSLETDFLASAVKQQAFRLFVTEGMFIDIGVPADYLRAQTDLADVERR
ncbi:nucleotidyltransferase family protein [Paraburkholderia sacchari]|uniref:nucleotidyltransferase family protein n=1 Tax=Paraburkholderia sacchari TaxID=159450 RepID=UPI000542EA49|nr:nucleotidyltransferase family protein [Paraburkholderia sacchari]NLP61662.1 NTP transferase domain-containing protein [Paraburkholderia sacchari]